MSLALYIWIFPPGPVILHGVVCFATLGTPLPDVLHSQELIEGRALSESHGFSPVLFLQDLCNDIHYFVVGNSQDIIKVLPGSQFIQVWKTRAKHEGCEIFREPAMAIQCYQVIIILKTLDLW